MIFCVTSHFVSTYNRFLVECRFPFPILRFLIIKSPSVILKSPFSRNKMLFKEHKLGKTIDSNNGFTLDENKFRFLRYIVWIQYQYTMTISNISMLWPMVRMHPVVTAHNPSSFIKIYQIIQTKKRFECIWSMISNDP